MIRSGTLWFVVVTLGVAGCDDISSDVVVHSQGECLPALVELTVRANTDLIEFCSGYAAIARGMTITGLTVEDLSAADCLCRVGGTLRVDANTGLIRLEGLERLDEIGGDLVIQDNPNLEALDDLSPESVGGRVRIVGNPRLAQQAAEAFALAIDPERDTSQDEIFDNGE